MTSYLGHNHQLISDKTTSFVGLGFLLVFRNTSEQHTRFYMPNKIQEMKPKPIGIHLGDFYSSVGTFEYTGVPEVIANDHGNLSTPSYVAFMGDQQVLIGEAAYDQANTNPKNTVFAVNRFIGRMFEDELVQEQIANVPFSVVNVDGWPMLEVEHNFEKKIFSPKEICSKILEKLKQTAESYLATKVTVAVITVPDYFNDSQRKAVKDAASTVELSVWDFISESKAVTIAYDLYKFEERKRKNVLILELNHEKTLNASIVDCAQGHELLALKSDNIVKGYKLTDVMVNRILREIEFQSTKIETYQSVIRNNEQFEEQFLKNGVLTDKENVRCMCKIGKKALLNNSSFSLKLSDLSLNKYYRNSYSYFKPRKIRCLKICEIVKYTFQSTEQLISEVLEKAKLIPTDIDAVILVGHTTRIFKYDLFFKTNFIGRNVKIYESILHDQVFAYGATARAAPMKNEYSTIERLFRFDCTPLSIGISIDSGIMYPVIERGTIFPTKISKIINIPTNTSGKSLYRIQIYEGQCLFAQDNNYLETLLIEGLDLEIKVIFEIDVKGTLIVSANRYKWLWGTIEIKSQPIKITNVKQRLKRAQIELMWENAELHRVRDDYVRKRIGSSTDIMISKIDYIYNYNIKFSPNFNGKYFDFGNPEIELSLIRSSIPQALNTKIEKLFEEMSDEVANANKGYSPISKMIKNLNNARDILNRYSLSKNEFDSVFANEQNVIVEIFEQTILVIRELLLYDFVRKSEMKTTFLFYGIKIKENSNISFSKSIPVNLLLKIREIQNLLILLVNVLRDKQTLFYGCSYFGVANNKEEIKCEDPGFDIFNSSGTLIQQTIETKVKKQMNDNENGKENQEDARSEILDSSITSIQQTKFEEKVKVEVEETKVEQLFHAFNSFSATSANNSQITNVIYNLKNVLFNTDSKSTFGDITFNNDESKHEIDLTKLEQAITVIQEIMLKIESKVITVPATEINGNHSDIEETNPNCDNVLQQMIEIEQLLNTLVSAKQSNRKSKSKKINHNKRYERRGLKGKQNIEKRYPNQSWNSIEQNFNNTQNLSENAKIVKYFEIDTKRENSSYSTDQQTIAVESIRQYSSNLQNMNENTKSHGEYCEGSMTIFKNKLKYDSQTESHITNLTQLIETAQTSEPVEQKIETNLSELQQSEAAECTIINQDKTTDSKTVQSLSELSNQNELKTSTTFKVVFNGALLAFVSYCLMKRALK